jgi:hypothetical protein
MPSRAVPNPASASPDPHLLPRRAVVEPGIARQARADYERFARGGLPRDLEAYLLETYNLDVTASFAGLRLKNPWGKGSGQLSMRLRQVEEAITAGLGLVVLKTVIAQDPSGKRSMEAWAIKESRMVAEPIVGLSGTPGWTITWKGRGWWQSFEAYLELVRDACALGAEHGVLVVPSVKYHLPAPDEQHWRLEEYETTTQRLLENHPGGRMPLEKDFSPTLAGSDRSRQQAKILEWLATIPGLVRNAAHGREVAIGLKLFNALYDDAFQLEMLRVVHGPSRPDFVTYANRLFNPDREFEGLRGVAYGGPDLSDRNLRMLTALRAAQAEGSIPATGVELSGTGNICSGRLAVEYALRGCTSFQLHTFFQLPPEVYPLKRGTKLERALHLLYFHPEEGFILWAHHAAKRLGLGAGGPVRLLDLAQRGATSAVRELDSQRA